MDSKQMTISVALATYNGAEFLPQQLQSLAEQSTLPLELVVCDDQSTDGTADVVEAFAKIAPFEVRFVRNPKNLGWRANFLKAASLCNGDLISFCDQDDIWYPEKIGRVLKEFASPATLACFHDADLIDREGSSYGTLLAHDHYPPVVAPLSRPFTWSNPLGLTITFRRELVNFNSLWASSIDRWAPGKPAAHDQWIFFLAITLGEATFVPQKLLGYRQHGRNTVGWAPGRGWSQFPKKLRQTEQKLADGLAMERSFIAIFKMAAATPELARYQPALLSAIQHHQALVDRLEGRFKLYSSPLVQRVNALRRLLRDRAYSKADPWKFGRKDMVIDSVLAAPFSPVFRYIGSEPVVSNN